MVKEFVEMDTELNLVAIWFTYKMVKRNEIFYNKLGYEICSQSDGYIVRGMDLKLRVVKSYRHAPPSGLLPLNTASFNEQWSESSAQWLHGKQKREIQFNLIILNSMELRIFFRYPRIWDNGGKIREQVVGTSELLLHIHGNWDTGVRDSKVQLYYAYYSITALLNKQICASLLLY